MWAGPELLCLTGFMPVTPRVVLSFASKIPTQPVPLEASADAIFEALQWLGIDWDEGPYFQSRRFNVYAEYVQKLLASGHAYYCTCSSEKLDAMRQQAMATGGKPKYDGTCREKQLSKQRCRGQISRSADRNHCHS